VFALLELFNDVLANTARCLGFRLWSARFST
jgi:hypothetical protein